jgi:hypothetical protein
MLPAAEQISAAGSRVQVQQHARNRAADGLLDADATPAKAHRLTRQQGQLEAERPRTMRHARVLAVRARDPLANLVEVIRTEPISPRWRSGK